MSKLKIKAVRFLSMLIVLIMISGLISIQAVAVSEKAFNGSVQKGKIEIELTNDNVTDTIIINLFPGDLYFAKQFVGYNYVYPGLHFTGDFVITNNSGQTYKVTDFSFEADTAYIRRVYNDAAKSKYGSMTIESKAIVKNLSGEEWYQLNAEYYGLENFYTLDVASQILGCGDLSQGLDIGVETSPELIALGEWYLFNNSQFSFNTDKYPISNLDVKDITLQDYIEKTSGNIDLVLNSCFSQEIGENGLTSTIGYSIDHSSVGNAYNGAYSDFKFTLTLSRVIKGASVSYHGNGHTGGASPSDDNLYDTGSSVIVLDNTGHLVKKGFVFNGWSLSPDGTGKRLKAGDSFLIDNDITLYAWWVPATDPSRPTPTTPPLPPPSEEIELDMLLGNLDDSNHIKYIFGYPDKSVKPNNSITRAETASIFFRLLTDSVKNNDYPSTFNDVLRDSWYSQAVSYLAYIGVITGYEDGTFRPDAFITRAEFAAIAARFDVLATTDENIFSDVPGNHWATQYINSSYHKGWINGYDNGAFKPEQHITRIEVIKLVNTMLNRLVKAEDLDDSLNPFHDLTRDYWGFAHILEASLDHLYTRNDDGTEIWNQ